MKKSESKKASATEFGGKQNRFRVSALQLALARDPTNKPGGHRGALGFKPHRHKYGQRVPKWMG